MQWSLRFTDASLRSLSLFLSLFTNTPQHMQVKTDARQAVCAGRARATFARLLITERKTKSTWPELVAVKSKQNSRPTKPQRTTTNHNNNNNEK